MNLSFAGCGFLGIYHVGVVSCFREYAPNLVNQFSGASAGAIAACSLLCDCPLGQVTSEVLKVASTARTFLLGPFSPKFDVTGILRDRMTTLLPADAHIRCTGRLHISCTRVSDGKNVIISEYNTKEELVQALLCSSFIPIFSGIIPPTYRGVRYIDGCYSDNLPVLDESTVTVSPFCGECDICPRDNSYNLLQVNWANTSIELSTQNLYRFMRVLFPPHPEILSQMCKQGFDDALQFLQRNDLITCTRCIAIHSTLQLHETSVSIPSSDSDDEEAEHRNCTECSHRKEVALLEDLPEAVLLVLEEACTSMNKGLINWVFRHKSMRILSVFTLPYVLPLDIAYVICVKLIQLLPKLRQDAVALVEKMIAHIQNVIKKFNRHRHFYSAKFTCQLAITEYDFEADDAYIPKPALRHTSPPCHRKVFLPLDANAPRRTSVERVLGRVNYDFTVDMANKIHSTPLTDTGPLSSAIGANSKERTAVEIVNAALQWEAHNPDNWDTQVDTFEQILEVTRRQEALISYYYLDENDQMKVTEIFNMTDVDTSALLPVDERETNHNLSWDGDWPTIVEEESIDSWSPSGTTLQSQLDSVLDCSFDGTLSGDDVYGDGGFGDDNDCYSSLLDVHIAPTPRKGSFAFLDQ